MKVRDDNMKMSAGGHEMNKTTKVRDEHYEIIQ
jgi:hypothetical protein